MCGIAGLSAATPDILVRLGGILAHRGPDGSGAFVCERTGFGLVHTRLAVIDLSEGGRQPMESSCGRWVIAFNGEIYNHAQLRAELEGRGHSFRSASDTEVLLALLADEGEAALARLVGMFAFALLDRHTGRVLLARDRVGIKPLFWGEHAGGLVAASTLAPFFALRDFPRKLDAEGLRDYLAFQTPLAPHTLVRDIHALPPGACLRWKPGSNAGATPRQWWTIPDATEAAPAAEALTGETDLLLARAVKDQLVADVSLGAFLSGGIDSSLVVHYMAQAGAQPIRTFSVRFAEAGFDESLAALAVAQKYGTEHHVLDAPQLGAETLAAALADLDQPLADPAYIPTWALSRLTRQRVTVALSGDGGDELFGGYPRFLDTAERHPDSAMKQLLRLLLRHGLAPASLTRRALAGAELLLYRRVELGDYPGSRKDLRAFLAPDIATSAQPERTLELWTQLATDHGNFDRSALLRADLWTYLSENCLTKTDRASMAHGLEVRVPLLANALQDRMLGLPAEVHFDAGGGKAILRALARKHLPEAVWNREKHGFSVPLRSNFAGPWRDWCDSQVSAAKMRAPWLDNGAISALWREARLGKGNPRLFYSFAVLLAWLEKHSLEA
jgi:asparagine synthase (glutamine-hydrolysing)